MQILTASMYTRLIIISYTTPGIERRESSIFTQWELLKGVFTRELMVKVLVNTVGIIQMVKGS